jgi:hypothetical protein
MPAAPPSAQPASGNRAAPVPTYAKPDVHNDYDDYDETDGSGYTYGDYASTYGRHPGLGRDDEPDSDGRAGAYGRTSDRGGYREIYRTDADDDSDRDDDDADDGDDGVIWRAAAAPPPPPARPAPPSLARPAPAAEPTPPPSGKRVRVVLAERKAAARPVRTVVDLQGDSPVGEALRTGLIVEQLRVALRFALFGGLTLGVLPVLFYVVPDLGTIAILGLRVPWLVLGILVYPFLLGLGWWFTSTAERVEQDFADHVQDN